MQVKCLPEDQRVYTSILVEDQRVYTSILVEDQRVYTSILVEAVEYGSNLPPLPEHLKRHDRSC